jgi:hypothetical protein
MWCDKMATEAGKIIECTLIGNIYDKDRDREIKKNLEIKKKNGAD